MRKQHFSAGDLIFAQGDPSAYAYVLEEGRVEIFRESADRAWVLGEIGPGEIFGEMGLVDERPRSAAARVLVDATVSAVTGDEFLQLLFDSSDEGVRYLKALFERLRVMNERAWEAAGNEKADYAQSDAGEPVALDRAVVVFPLGERVRNSISDTGRTVDRFPFRVGRASSGVLGDNHLEVQDSQPYNMSRNHFLIDRSEQGFFVRDRGSFLGTVVNGEKIGGKRSKGRAMLKSGENVVIAGDRASPFRFKIMVAAAE